MSNIFWVKVLYSINKLVEIASDKSLIFGVLFGHHKVSKVPIRSQLHKNVWNIEGLAMGSAWALGFRVHYPDNIAVTEVMESGLLDVTLINFIISEGKDLHSKLLLGFGCLYEVDCEFWFVEDVSDDDLFVFVERGGGFGAWGGGLLSFLDWVWCGAFYLHVRYYGRRKLKENENGGRK